MSYVMAAPEMMAAAATDVAAVGSTLSAAHMAAAAPTVAVIPAAADEVSASIAQLFSKHAQDYQAAAGQAAAFQQQFVQHLTAGASSYTAAEAANAVSLQPLTAIAGSAASAIADLPGQLSNMVTSFWNSLTYNVNTFVTDVVNIANLAYTVIYLLLVFVVLVFELLARMIFGISIPVSLP